MIGVTLPKPTTAKIGNAFFAAFLKNSLLEEIAFSFSILKNI